MQDYVQTYVNLCSLLCKEPEDYSPENVIVHNQAMKELLRLTESLQKDMLLALDVYAALLEHEDIYVRHAAATDCLSLNIHIKRAVRVLKIICWTGSKSSKMAAKRVLKIWRKKLTPDQPF